MFLFAIIGAKFYTVVLWTWRAERRRIISFRRSRDGEERGLSLKYTDEELTNLVKKEGTLSNWEKASSMTKSEIEASVAADSDEAEMVMEWDNTTVELPQPKAVLNMRIDKDVLDFSARPAKATNHALTPFCGRMSNGESISIIKRDEYDANRSLIRIEKASPSVSVPEGYSGVSWFAPER